MVLVCPAGHTKSVVLQWFPAVPPGNVAFPNIFDHGLLVHKNPKDLLHWAIYMNGNAHIAMQRPGGGQGVDLCPDRDVDRRSCTFAILGVVARSA